MAESFYKKKRWVKLRAYVLKRDAYRCQIASRYGKNVNANTVHHIFPRDIFPEYQWETWNLISVSQEEHNKLHNRATGDLSDYGMELLQRTARKLGIELDGRISERIS